MAGRYDSRYSVEQKMLPDALYSSGGTPINDAVSLMERLYDEVGDDGSRYSFTETQRVYSMGDIAILVHRIGMPAPLVPRHSRAVYLCSSDQSGEDMYFASELGENGKFMLCCKPNYEKIQHMVCGAATETVDEEFAMVADRYWALVFDGGLAAIETDSAI